MPCALNVLNAPNVFLGGNGVWLCDTLSLLVFTRVNLRTISCEIFGLLRADMVLISVHDDIPASDIPQIPSANNARNIAANGSHVVILGLFDASRVVMNGHMYNAVSPMLHVPRAKSVRIALCDDPHIEIFGLSLASKYSIRVQ